MAIFETICKWDFFFFLVSGDFSRKIDKTVDDKSHNNNSISDEANDREKLQTPIDWKPQENCYFCVDGKLLTVNDKGDLVAESGSVNTEPELANRVRSININYNANVSKNEKKKSIGIQWLKYVFSPFFLQFFFSSFPYVIFFIRL